MLAQDTNMSNPAFRTATTTRVYRRVTTTLPTRLGSRHSRTRPLKLRLPKCITIPSSGSSGPWLDTGAYFGTLEDFKDGIVEEIGDDNTAPVYADKLLLEIQIEVDNWIGPSEAYIDNITINGELLLSEPKPPTIVVKEPKDTIYEPGKVPVKISVHDLFGLDRVWYNVKKSNGKWLYGENRTYTSSTYMSGLTIGDYRFYAWANNSLGLTGTNSTVMFSVRASVLTVEIHPRTLNLRSKGKYVTVVVMFPQEYSTEDIDIETIKLVVEGKTVPSMWGRVDEGMLMVKFNRSALQELVSPDGEVELTVIVKLSDGTPFDGSDTIRVIAPGKKGFNPNTNESINGGGKKNQNWSKLGWIRRWQKGNNGKQNRNNKGGKK